MGEFGSQLMVKRLGSVLCCDSSLEKLYDGGGDRIPPQCCFQYSTMERRVDKVRLLISLEAPDPDSDESGGEEEQHADLRQQLGEGCPACQ